MIKVDYVRRILSTVNLSSDSLEVISENEFVVSGLDGVSISSMYTDLLRTSYSDDTSVIRVPKNKHDNSGIVFFIQKGLLDGVERDARLYITNESVGVLRFLYMN